MLSQIFEMELVKSIEELDDFLPSLSIINISFDSSDAVQCFWYSCVSFSSKSGAIPGALVLETALDSPEVKKKSGIGRQDKERSEIKTSPSISSLTFSLTA